MGWLVRLRAEDSRLEKIGVPLRHEEDVRAVAFSPDGRRVSPAARTGRCGCGMWPPVTPGAARCASTGVEAVAFSPDGPTVLTGSWDGTAQLWETVTAQPQGSRCARRPGHSRRLQPRRPTVLTASLDATAQLWDAATHQPRRPPFRHQQPIRAAAFRPDGRTVVHPRGKTTRPGSGTRRPASSWGLP